jgi:hypothetical protein
MNQRGLIARQRKIVFIVTYFLTLIFLRFLKNYIFIQFNFLIFNVIFNYDDYIYIYIKEEFRE